MRREVRFFARGPSSPPAPKFGTWRWREFDCPGVGFTSLPTWIDHLTTAHVFISWRIVYVFNAFCLDEYLFCGTPPNSLFLANKPLTTFSYFRTVTFVSTTCTTSRSPCFRGGWHNLFFPYPISNGLSAVFVIQLLYSPLDGRSLHYYPG